MAGSSCYSHRMWTVFGTTDEWSAEWLQGWAGWAQAVGTIAAVWMAARLAQKSLEQDQLDRLTAHYDALEVLYQACGRIIMNLHNAANMPQMNISAPQERPSPISSKLSKLYPSLIFATNS